MTVEHFRNLVIGSGEAGKYLAWSLARMGQSTAVVERSMIGGSCPNVACLPSKNIIYSAKAVSLVGPTTGLGVVTGSQQALRIVEDFTEFEQRAAYIDGDITTAAEKGTNPQERGSQVHFMAEFQELLDFPPAPSSKSWANSTRLKRHLANCAARNWFWERPRARFIIRPRCTLAI